MIAEVVNQLDTALKGGTTGLQVHIDAVESDKSVTLPDIKDASIYGLDAPVNIQTVNLPALVVTPVGTDTASQSSQGTRDSAHTVGFEWATDQPDENEWRNDAIYVAEALMRFLDNFNANDSDYVGTSGVILVDGWSADYAVTWQEPPNAIRGFTLQADILARDTFS